MRPDKRTSNLFIAGGYCLVAIIILLNYLGQAEIKDKKTARPGELNSSPLDESAIARQLKEEKRVNTEMREMLTRLQSLLSDPQRAVMKHSPAAVPAQGRYEIPEINYDLLDASRPRTNPFIPGKNPYSSPTRRESNAAVGKRGLGSNLRCDPRLPFVISGSGLRSAFIANF